MFADWNACGVREKSEGRSVRDARAASCVEGEYCANWLREDSEEDFFCFLDKEEEKDGYAVEEGLDAYCS